MKIRDLLGLKEFKNRSVVTIGPKESLSAAVQKLVDHDIGALAVCNDKGELVGIITERDILRKYFRLSNLKDRKVEDVMTREVAIGSPEDDVDYAMNVMKQKKIRHLPIMQDQKLLSMLSMRDLLGFQLEEAKAEVKYAQYVGRHPRRRIV